MLGENLALLRAQRQALQRSLKKIREKANQGVNAYYAHKLERALLTIIDMASAALKEYSGRPRRRRRR